MERTKHAPSQSFADELTSATTIKHFEELRGQIKKAEAERDALVANLENILTAIRLGHHLDPSMGAFREAEAALAKARE